MKVKVKRFDKSLPLPQYQTEGAAALDLSARVEMKIEPRSIGYVPLNIALQLPPNHWILMAARSSLHKQGLMLINGIGVGDYDYRGNNDEYRAALYNFTDQPVQISKGQRVSQMIVLPREKVEFEELDQFQTDDRGGFGSTGS
ncbi:MAG: dUTP diphosphatase [Candidatus Pacebacteria bacterium]|nr:dUTP diphosphatase [Candidatus Paceibacterota bacterium]